MIKVLTHGTAHHINVCPSCGCKFEWDERNADICKEISPNKLTIFCPECGLTRKVEKWVEEAE